HVPRTARTAAVEVALNVGLGKHEAGRAAVDDAAHRNPVALAESRDREHAAVGIACHTLAPSRFKLRLLPAAANPPPRARTRRHRRARARARSAGARDAAPR